MPVGGAPARKGPGVYTMAVLKRETGVCHQAVARLVAGGGMPPPRGRDGHKGPRWGPEHLSALRSYVAFCADRFARQQAAGAPKRTGVGGKRFGSYRCLAEFCERQRRARG